MTIVNIGQGKGVATPQYATPTTGQAVSINGGPGDVSLMLTPATDLAALTVTLPNINIGNTVYISSTKNIVLLTINGASINNSVSTIMANDTIAFVKIDANTFSRVVAS